MARLCTCQQRTRPHASNLSALAKSAVVRSRSSSVQSPATLTVLDVADGHPLWQARPPIVYPTPTGISDGTVELSGQVSPAKCSSSAATLTLDASSGALIDAHVVPSQSLKEAMPPITDDGVTIRYILDTSTPESSTGVEAVYTATGSTLWRNVKPGPDGPAPLYPPLVDSGVFVVAVGGRNPLDQGPATAIQFIDERTGATLWDSLGRFVRQRADGRRERLYKSELIRGPDQGP